MERVILVVLDGLRADAPALFSMKHLARLADAGAATFGAQTVTPSVTAAAMASLFTGVTPAEHGLDSDRFRLPKPIVRLRPVPQVLADAGIPMYARLARLPVTYRALAAQIARLIGVSDASFSGDSACEILQQARALLTGQRRGLFFFHWPDADRAGHRSGWMSGDYCDAVRSLDDALGTLDEWTGASTDSQSLLIVLADHGGGGVDARNHASDHVHDTTIPIIISGGSVSPRDLGSGASLLDVPATVLWSFGIEIPQGYRGRPLTDALVQAPPADARQQAELVLA